MSSDYLAAKQRYGIGALNVSLAQLKKEERINFLERSPATGGITYTVTLIPISFLDRRYDNSWNATVSRESLLGFWGNRAQIVCPSEYRGWHQALDGDDTRSRV